MMTLLLTLSQAIPQSSPVPLHNLSADSGDFGPSVYHLRKLGILRVHSIQASQPEQNSDLYHDLSALLLRGWSDAGLLYLA